jgi:hypothetical protein
MNKFLHFFLNIKFLLAIILFIFIGLMISIFLRLFCYDKEDIEPNFFTQLSDFFYSVGIALFTGGLINFYNAPKYFEDFKEAFYYSSPIFIGLFLIFTKEKIIKKSRLMVFLAICSFLSLIFIILYKLN